MTTVVDALLPLLAILLGAGITYWVNVRQRQRTYVEELFDSAMAAVSAAEVSVDFLAQAGQPQHMTDEDYATFQSWLVTENLKNWANKVREANEALARVLPYQPDIAAVLPFSPGADTRGTHTEVIRLLRQGLREG